MTNEKETCATHHHHHHGNRLHTHGASDGLYGLGFIGAAIYFIQHATTFWMGALGILKACVWPAFVVYKWLEFLQIK